MVESRWDAVGEENKEEEKKISHSSRRHKKRESNDKREEKKIITCGHGCYNLPLLKYIASPKFVAPNLNYRVNHHISNNHASIAHFDN